MITVTQKNQKKEKSYPYFGISEDGTLVLFVRPDRGIVIWADACKPFYLVSISDIDEYTYTPFEGDIHVTL